MWFGTRQVIRAIEATAEAEERGVYRDHCAAGQKKHVHVVGALDTGGGEEEGFCCEKHAFQLERSAAHRLEERVKETSSKVRIPFSLWLVQ